MLKHKDKDEPYLMSIQSFVGVFLLFLLVDQWLSQRDTMAKIIIATSDIKSHDLIFKNI